MSAATIIKEVKGYHPFVKWMIALVVIGELGPLTAFSHHILPVLVGNVIGGTGLFAMLAYGQIRREM